VDLGLIQNRFFKEEASKVGVIYSGLMEIETSEHQVQSEKWGR